MVFKNQCYFKNMLDFYSCVSSTATIEYSSPFVCLPVPVCVCVCMCVCVYVVVQGN